MDDNTFHPDYLHPDSFASPATSPLAFADVQTAQSSFSSHPLSDYSRDDYLHPGNAKPHYAVFTVRSDDRYGSSPVRDEVNTGIYLNPGLPRIQTDATINPDCSHKRKQGDYTGLIRNYQPSSSSLPDPTTDYDRNWNAQNIYHIPQEVDTDSIYNSIADAPTPPPIRRASDIKAQKLPTVIKSNQTSMKIEANEPGTIVVNLIPPADSDSERRHPAEASEDVKVPKNTALMILSCFSLWFCNPLFGAIAFALTFAVSSLSNSKRNVERAWKLTIFAATFVGFAVVSGVAVWITLALFTFEII